MLLALRCLCVFNAKTRRNRFEAMIKQKVILDSIQSECQVQANYSCIREQEARIDEIFDGLEDDEEPAESTEEMDVDLDAVEMDVKSDFFNLSIQEMTYRPFM